MLKMMQVIKEKLVFIVEHLKFFSVEIYFINVKYPKFCLLTIAVQLLDNTNFRSEVYLKYHILF